MKSEYTLAAIKEEQRQLTERSKLQYLKLLRDRAQQAQQEYEKALLLY